MSPIIVLGEADIRTSVGLHLEALQAVEDVFTRLARGQATVPPIIGIDIAERHGEVDVKTAYVHGLDSFAIKIASGFYDNTSLGLPTSSGMMVVISTRTGFPEAVLLDNGYLTDVRTALAGAIAAKYLSLPRFDTVGIVGAGGQGRYQVMALKLVREFKRVMVYDSNPDVLGPFVSEMSTLLGLEVVAETNPGTLVRESSVVVTCTPSRQPYVRAEWLHPGLHITAMGTDSSDKQELHAEVLGRADRLVCDLRSQCFVRGELHHGLDAGIISEQDDITELGQLTGGLVPGRTRDDEITICDLTGVGVQDTAIALLAYRKATERGLGVRFTG